ncbi:hypothetical protein FSP39_017825 [Pinctada imbricata]|uniref:Uncharacterized protein n=1 Tax=Pinctada imbricata TaxID=66713 RepID=A0AA88XZM8_PINIB|nr:hypothetical protein FSP39_017825 [Pinctada imbricata]
MAIMKGAVLFGFRPSTIYARKCRYTYGIKVFAEFDEGKHPIDKLKIIDGEKKCDDVFAVLVREGDVIKINEARCVSLTNSHREETSRFIRLQTSIYASSSYDPKFTTDEGCSLIGTITNDPPPCCWSDHVQFRTYVYFGRTEIRVLDHDETHGRGYFQKFSLLAEESITETN